MPENGDATITDYMGPCLAIDIPSAHLVIPDELDGYPVTGIGGSAFTDYYYDLIGVTIPNSMTSIGGEAFTGCIHLTNLILPASVAHIGESIFIGCSNSP